MDIVRFDHEKMLDLGSVEIADIRPASGTFKPRERIWAIDEDAIKACSLAKGAHLGVGICEERRTADDPASQNGIIAIADLEDFDRNFERRVFYISDIHLEHCIANKLGLNPDKDAIRHYIAELVDQLVKSKRQFDKPTSIELELEYYEDDDLLDLMDEGMVYETLLVGGDVSCSIELSRMFFEELARRWDSSKVVVILGNHELWECERSDASAKDAVDFMVKRYGEMLGELGFVFAQNELLVLSDNFRWRCLSEDFILDDGCAYAVDYWCHMGSLILLCGIGFSGLEPEFNADLGIYRDTVRTLEEDRELSERFERLHDRMLEIAGDKEVIVFTHSPYWEWTSKAPNPKWRYVCGHNHHNQLEVSESRALYADNQVGYHRDSIELKCFAQKRTYDIFSDRADGVYLISRGQYRAFNRGLGILMEFNRGDDVVMLKRRGVYLFLFRDKERDKIYLLDGGKIRNLAVQDIGYYFEHMSDYAEVMRLAANDYENALKSISSAVKQMGGEGRIHGAIVDIDFYNHIMLSPIDGALTFYYAESIVSKRFYDDFPTLLSERAPWMLPGYEKLLIESGDKGIKLLEGEKPQTDSIRTAIEVADTSMYGPSRVARKIQYLFDSNVIRVWNEDALESARRASTPIDSKSK